VHRALVIWYMRDVMWLYEVRLIDERCNDLEVLPEAEDFAGRLINYMKKQPPASKPASMRTRAMHGWVKAVSRAIAQEQGADNICLPPDDPALQLMRHELWENTSPAATQAPGVAPLRLWGEFLFPDEASPESSDRGDDQPPNAE